MRYSNRVAIFDSVSAKSNIRYVKAQDVAGWPLVLYVETDPRASGFVRGGCPRGTRFTNVAVNPQFLPRQGNYRSCYLQHKKNEGISIALSECKL
jgi:hypothetical protein